MKKNRLVIAAAILTVVGTAIHIADMLGFIIWAFMSWIFVKGPLFLAALLWIVQFVLFMKRKLRKDAVICLLMAVVSILISGIWISQLRFKLMPERYEAAAQEYVIMAQELEEDGLSELGNAGFMGKVLCFKEKRDILVMFQERESFLSRNVYVKCYADTDISTLLPDAENVQYMGDRWYYLSLY